MLFKSLSTKNTSRAMLLTFALVMLCSSVLSAEAEIVNHCTVKTCVECEKASNGNTGLSCDTCYNSFKVADNDTDNLYKCDTTNMPENCFQPHSPTQSGYSGCKYCANGYKPVVGAEASGKKPVTCVEGEPTPNCMIAGVNSSDQV